MKKISILLLAAATASLFSGCGLSIYEDWKKSGGKAITGAGAIAGKDYVTGLTPSENSRKYFARISGDNRPIETVRRSDEGESKSGVRFVKNGGILIPPGVTISFENKGYCMDPNLPAPKAGEEYQLIPMTQLIPEDLQGMYKKLVTKASAGDESVQRNMQHLVWALRTAGTEAAYANNLTREQKKILDRCGEYPGQFEEFNANAKANSKALKELVGLADSFLNVKIGGVSYKASDLLDPDVGSRKINEHLNQLIGMSAHLPVEKTGFNFGEIQPGIYTDVQGTGYLQYRAKIANTTNQPFIYYPSEYVGQVGSPTKNGGMATYVTADTTMRQRVTGGNPNDVKAQGEPKPEEPEKEKKCPPHVWRVTEKQTNKALEPNITDVEKKQKERMDKAKEIERIRKRLLEQLSDNDNKLPGLEYGAVIYSLNGNIYASKISAGNYAYEFGSKTKPMQRVSLNDDGNYYIVQKDGRYIVPPRKTESKYGDYEHLKDRTAEISYDASTFGILISGLFNDYFLCDSGSWNPDKFSLPEGATALEYVHLHPEESQLSYQDLRLASERGVNITVVTPKGNDTTFYPEDFSYTSTNGSKKLKSEYSKVENELFTIFSYECVKCGATK